MSNTVRVVNLPYNTQDNALKEFFSQVGNVISARNEYDHETGRHKGFGFVEYADRDGAQNAVNNLDGAEFNGRNLRVSFA